MSTALTPEKLMEGMSSFVPREQETSQTLPQNPRAPPPAAPPPTPPITTSTTTTSTTTTRSSLEGSFQQQQQQHNYARKGSNAALPIVTNYSLADDDELNLLHSSSRSDSFRASSSSGLRGDASIRPNTGFHNASDDQGEALLEVLWKMRTMNIVGCIMALFLGLPDVFTHVFQLHPAQLVLNVYRLFFTTLLGCYELHTPYIRQVVIDNFGLIHHPIGRTFFLFLLSGLCVSQGSILDILVGVLFLLTAFMTFYAYCKYPEYRRIVDEQPDLTAMARRRLGGSRNFSWAQPDVVATNIVRSGLLKDDETGVYGERSSLMSSSSSSFRV